MSQVGHVKLENEYLTSLGEEEKEETNKLNSSCKKNMMINMVSVGNNHRASTNATKPKCRTVWGR